MHKIALFILLIIPGIVFADASVYVLCYHSFIGNSAFDTDFSNSEMLNQMTLLTNYGYQFVSLEDVLSNRISGDNNILITIDDGNFSISDTYDQVFEPLGIEPVLFIYPAIVSTMSYALTYDQILDIMDRGASVGGHGYHHLFVTQDLYDTDLTSFNREIYKSKRYIEINLGFNPDVYAYPYGAYSAITLEHLSLAGWKYAFTIDEGVLKTPIEEHHNPLELPRYMVTRSNWETVFDLLKSASPSASES